VEKYDIVVSFNSKNGTKVAKPARDFDIPRTTLTTNLKNKDKIISHILQSICENTLQQVVIMIKNMFNPCQVLGLKLHTILETYYCSLATTTVCL